MRAKEVAITFRPDEKTLAAANTAITVLSSVLKAFPMITLVRPKEESLISLIQAIDIPVHRSIIMELNIKGKKLFPTLCASLTKAGITEQAITWMLCSKDCLPPSDLLLNAYLASFKKYGSKHPRKDVAKRVLEEMQGRVKFFLEQLRIIRGISKGITRIGKTTRISVPPIVLHARYQGIPPLVLKQNSKV